MFKETKDGETHHFGDGHGHECIHGNNSDTCPKARLEENPKTNNEWETILEYSLPDKLWEEEKRVIRNNVESILSSERQRVREEIEKMKQPTPYTKDRTMEDVVDGYNEALSDILNSDILKLL